MKDNNILDLREDDVSQENDQTSSMKSNYGDRNDAPAIVAGMADNDDGSRIYERERLNRDADMF